MKQSCWRNKINNFNGMYMFKKIIIKKVFILLIITHTLFIDVTSW